MRAALALGLATAILPLAAFAEPAADCLQVSADLRLCGPLDAPWMAAEAEQGGDDFALLREGARLAFFRSGREMAAAADLAETTAIMADARDNAVVTPLDPVTLNGLTLHRAQVLGDFDGEAAPAVVARGEGGGATTTLVLSAPADMAPDRALALMDEAQALLRPGPPLRDDPSGDPDRLCLVADDPVLLCALSPWAMTVTDAAAGLISDPDRGLSLVLRAGETAADPAAMAAVASLGAPLADATPETTPYFDASHLPAPEDAADPVTLRVIWPQGVAHVTRLEGDPAITIATRLPGRMAADRLAEFHGQTLSMLRRDCRATDDCGQGQPLPPHQKKGN